MALANIRACDDGNVSGQYGPPVQRHYSLDPSSDAIRIFDPCELSGGLMSRGDETSTSLLGFAAAPSVRTEPPQIAAMPFSLDAEGRKLIPVHLAARNNVFEGRVKPSVALSIVDHVGLACDLIAACPAPTPVLTTHGTADTTHRDYQIVPKNLLGYGKAKTATTLTTGNATLSDANYDIITIPDVPGATHFRIYLGGYFIAEVPANAGTTTVYNNTGADAPTTETPSAVNDTGWRIDPAATSTQVVVITDLIDPEGTYGGRVRFMVPAAKSQFPG